MALIGATGALGQEILEQLADRSFPVAELRAYATEASEGDTLEFQGEDVEVAEFDPAALGRSELAFCAAPGAIAPALEQLREQSLHLIDASGALELDPGVPLHTRGSAAAGGGGGPRWIAVPRGVVGGLALALGALAREVELTRATIVTCEPASGAGRRGATELAEQTAQVLNAMDGDPPESELFPRPLAFDCVPLVGSLLDNGSSSEEARMAILLGRLLGAPSLPIEVTRVRVPTFSGSLASVHLAVSHDLSALRAVAAWEKLPGVRVVDSGLPTPRTALGSGDVCIGRVRPGREDAPGLAFALALDDVRHTAQAAVEAAEALLA